MTLAARLLLGEEREEELYRPVARVAEGARLRQLASACTDASDGVLQAVGMLTALNGLGARLDWNPQTLDDGAVAYLRDKDLPLWPLWISEIAELELLLAIPERNLAAALAAVPSLNPIGRLTASTGVTVAVEERTISVDPHGVPSLVRTEASSRLETALDVLAEIRELGLP
jgi:thiamine monophosphate kinase